MCSATTGYEKALILWLLQQFVFICHGSLPNSLKAELTRISEIRAVTSRFSKQKIQDCLLAHIVYLCCGSQFRNVCKRPACNTLI